MQHRRAQTEVAHSYTPHTKGLYRQPPPVNKRPNWSVHYGHRISLIQPFLFVGRHEGTGRLGVPVYKSCEINKRSACSKKIFNQEDFKNNLFCWIAVQETSWHVPISSKFQHNLPLLEPKLICQQEHPKLSTSLNSSTTKLTLLGDTNSSTTPPCGFCVLATDTQTPVMTQSPMIPA